MRVLVTGAEGFAGRHLISELQAHNHDVVTTDHPDLCNRTGDCEHHACDLTDENAVNGLVKNVTPDACAHLGGIAYVPVGWTNPKLMFTVNVIGTINLIEAFRKNSDSARLLVVSSSEIYGTKKANTSLTENDSLAPENPYAVSKAAADTEALLYFQKYSMPVMTARPSNHIGPGQRPDFVVPSFAQQLIKIKASNKPGHQMKVGNLDSTRDFTDVRDVVRAYRLIMESGRAGHAYNIAGGSAVKISRILSELCEIVGVSPDIKVDPAKYRPSSSQQMIDTSAILNDTGWKPEITLRHSLQDVVAELIHAGDSKT